jgi:hypothetical protein
MWHLDWQHMGMVKRDTDAMERTGVSAQSRDLDTPHGFGPFLDGLANVDNVLSVFSGFVRALGLRII